MKKLFLVAALALPLAMPAWAKNFAFPRANPVATVTIPDSWKTESIDYGFSAKSPDGDVFFSVESTSAKNIDKMMKANTDWMKENKIKLSDKPQEGKFDLGGLQASMVRHETTDENGPTIVDFVFTEGGKDRLIMLTLWASEKEREANAADIKAIQSSIKSIN